MHIVFYLVLGWSAAIFFGDLIAFNKIFFILIVSGGFAYSLGVVSYLLSSKIKYSHFI
ncbi:hypothetical protein FACS1894166_13320 [Bacilli bacterium]|nr:hypothetical protein FACS1894166_13320 [Bacilli bacterium]